MAIHATHVVFQVRRAQKIGVLFAELMATQATLGRLLARHAGEAQDLVGIAGFGVLLARTVAGFTTLPLRTVALVQRRLPVRAGLIALGLLFMAGLAGVGADVLLRINRRVLHFGALLSLLLIGGGLAGLRGNSGTLVTPILPGPGHAQRDQPQHKERQYEQPCDYFS